MSYKVSIFAVLDLRTDDHSMKKIFIETFNGNNRLQFKQFCLAPGRHFEYIKPRCAMTSKSAIQVNQNYHHIDAQSLGKNFPYYAHIQVVRSWILSSRNYLEKV